MRKNRLNICYYPTSLILVDDNKKFLQSLRLGLSDYSCYFYENPKKALDFLNDSYKYEPFINRSLLSEEDNHVEQPVAGLNIKKIHHEIYNSSRYEEISVLLADYSMPYKNGSEFCKEIQSKYLQKVMLTGEASNELAIAAFNEGIINKFILKSSIGFLNVIMNNIQELQENYFITLTDIALSKINKNNILAIIEDPVFIELFNNLCKKHQIVEYYLLDEQGSYLLLDKNKKMKWLIVKKESEMKNLINFAAFEEAPEPILNALQNRDKLPYFHTEIELNKPPSEWEEYLYPAIKLHGKELYYYSFIDDLTPLNMEMEKILSYSNFLDNLVI